MGPLLEEVKPALEKVSEILLRIDQAISAVRELLAGAGGFATEISQIFQNGPAVANVIGDVEDSVKDYILKGSINRGW